MGRGGIRGARGIGVYGIRLELKAIEYVKMHVFNLINDVRDALLRENISEDHLEQILVEGHLYAMRELGFSHYSNLKDRIYSKYLESSPHERAN